MARGVTLGGGLNVSASKRAFDLSVLFQFDPGGGVVARGKPVLIAEPSGTLDMATGQPGQPFLPASSDFMVRYSGQDRALLLHSSDRIAIKAVVDGILDRIVHLGAELVPMNRHVLTWKKKEGSDFKPMSVVALRRAINIALGKQYIRDLVELAAMQEFDLKKVLEEIHMYVRQVCCNGTNVDVYRGVEI